MPFLFPSLRWPAAKPTVGEDLHEARKKQLSSYERTTALLQDLREALNEEGPPKTVLGKLGAKIG